MRMQDYIATYWPQALMLFAFSASCVSSYVNHGKRTVTINKRFTALLAYTFWLFVLYQGGFFDQRHVSSGILLEVRP